MNKKLILVYLLSLFVIQNINAQQLDLLHQDDNVKIKKMSKSNTYSEIIRDYDEDSFWINYFDYNVANKAIKLNSNGDIVNQYYLSTTNIVPPNIKLNNKFYRIFPNTQIGVDTIKTLDLRCTDSLGNELMWKSIVKFEDDTLLWSNTYKTLVTQEKELIFVNSVSPKSEYDFDVNAFRILKIDTSGNLLKSKIIFDTIRDFNLCEMGNHILLAKSVNTASNNKIKVYYINKNSLEIDDSILFYSKYMKKINDSLVFLLGFDILNTPIYPVQIINQLNIFNKNTKEIKKIKYFRLSGQDSEKWADLDNISESGERMDFINQDSIYLVYNVRNGSGMNGDYSGSLCIVNFNHTTMDTNFVYRMDFDTISSKQLRGVKATPDGGLMMLALSSPYPYTTRNTWIIKFMPNGFVGLSNVESGERASLSVYPNPAKDFVLVDIEADRFDKADIEIYDLGGKMVKSSRLSAKVGNRIDVSDLKAGVYGYRVELNGKGVSGKIVVGE
ncbi:MAG: Peptidase subtilisin/kexin/sedolisin [Bacteroidetes bacterium]|nr:Peptidase subtilisin/kexin/sedolisin [Bacteroidota bacterium]